jgi:hypothetical protein
VITGQSKAPAICKHANVRFLAKPFFPSVRLDLLKELLAE